MTLPPISTEKARRVARSGDLPGIRAMGREHMVRNAAWERKSLECIRRHHGQVGVIAALDGDNAAHACLHLCQLPDSWYLGRHGLGFWAQPGLPCIWQELCRGTGGYFKKTKLTGKECWDGVMAQLELTTDTTVAATSALDMSALDPASLLWPASQRSCVSWNSWMHALGNAYFLGTADHGATSSSCEQVPLYSLVRHARLLARGRLSALLAQIEPDPSLKSSRLAARNALAWGALQAGKPGLFRRFRQWGTAPIALPNGEDMMEAGLLACDASLGPVELRWRCLQQIGARRAEVLQGYLADARRLERLLQLAGDGQADHVVDILSRAAQAGVDLSKMRDLKGQPLDESIRLRAAERVGRAVSAVQHMTLQQDTTPTTRNPSRARL